MVTRRKVIAAATEFATHVATHPVNKALCEELIEKLEQLEPSQTLAWLQALLKETNRIGSNPALTRLNRKVCADKRLNKRLHAVLQNMRRWQGT